MARVLKNKPLEEAIFVLKWELKKNIEDQSDEEYVSDPSFKLLIGRFWEKIKEQFPHFEELDASETSYDFGTFVPQFKFSKTPDKYPFVMLGPGIISVHDSEDYVWNTFEQQIFLIVNAFHQSYPKPEEILIVDMYLRYADAIIFDFQKENVLEFLRDQMKVDISINNSVFQNTGVYPVPQGFDVRFSFFSEDPKSVTHLRFSRGGEKGEKIMWETVVQVYQKIPQNEDEIKSWATQAHELADILFFNTIEGKLLERFA